MNIDRGLRRLLVVIIVLGPAVYAFIITLKYKDAAQLFFIPLFWPYFPIVLYVSVVSTELLMGGHPVWGVLCLTPIVIGIGWLGRWLVRGFRDTRYKTTPDMDESMRRWRRLGMD